jgi:hypothetical protein
VRVRSTPSAPASLVVSAVDSVADLQYEWPRIVAGFRDEAVGPLFPGPKIGGGLLSQERISSA